MFSDSIKILTLGDIVGPKATDTICARLWSYRSENKIDFVVANAENACQGNGLTPATAKKLLSSGVDVITSGNHIWHKKEIYDWLDSGYPVLRPANYPSSAPGTGYCINNINGFNILTINILGVVYLDSLANPFECVDKILDRCAGKFDFSVIDIHAEATSEKAALAYYFDGRVSAIFGTHTHVQTSDERVLQGGCGFITDLGMCGPDNSILGIRPDCIIEKMTTLMPVRFEIADSDISMCGAVFDIDTTTFKTKSITRIKEKL